MRARRAMSGGGTTRPWGALLFVAWTAGCSGGGSSVQPMGAPSPSPADGAADGHALDEDAPDVDGNRVARDAEPQDAEPQEAEPQDAGLDSHVACPSASPFSSESCPFTAASERLLCA